MKPLWLSEVPLQTRLPPGPVGQATRVVDPVTATVLQLALAGLPIGADRNINAQLLIRRLLRPTQYAVHAQRRQGALLNSSTRLTKRC
jgi:hypothetical protein